MSGLQLQQTNGSLQWCQEINVGIYMQLLSLAMKNLSRVCNDITLAGNRSILKLSQFYNDARLAVENKCRV